MSGSRRVPHERLREFCSAVLERGGVDRVQARDVTGNLVWSELVGRENFGLLRLPVYLDRVENGGLKCPCHPVFEDISANLARLEADDGFGQYAGKLAMERAIALARRTGLGAVGVANSNFFGTGAYFVQMAAAEQMIGVAMSNSFPKVIAHGGLTAVLGTNPLAFGAPRENGESVLFDMATSALAGSTIREHMATGEPLPQGMAIDANGHPITDPAKAGAGALLPAAGAKGYGLSLMVEILAGVMTGAGVSGGVASMYEQLSEPGHNGHFMLAIDPARFMPIAQFTERLEMLVAMVKASNPETEILMPGEIRWQTYNDNVSNGLVLGTPAREAIKSISEKFKVDPPWRQLAQSV